MSLRVSVGYAMGALGCAAIAYALHTLLSTGSCISGRASVVCRSNSPTGDLLILGGLILGIGSMYLGGGRFTFPGLWAAPGVGMLTVSGEGAPPKWFGAIFVGAGIYMLFLLWPRALVSKADKAQHKKLVAEGMPVIGTVLRVHKIVDPRAHGPRVQLRVRIEPVDGPPFEVERIMTLRLDQPALVGRRYPVLYLPDQPNKFELITDIGSVPTELRTVLEELEL